MTADRHASPRTDAEFRIPDEALATDVDRVVADLGRPPAVREYDEQGDYAAETVAARFGDGSWVDALDALGHRVGSRRGQALDRETLVDDLRRVADAVGRPPTVQEYTDRGRHSSATIARRLGDGSWVAALETLGYEVSEDRHRRSRVGADALRADVARVAAELGGPPTVVEYQERGTYDPTTISRRFGDGFWAAALAALGYDPAGRGAASVADDPLREAVERAVADVGRPPTRAEFAARSEFAPQTIANRFGNGLWRAALDALGYDVADRPEPNAITESDLREDLERVVAEVGRVPTVREYNEHGEYAAQTIANRFGAGSWRDALATLGYSESRSQQSRSISAETLRDDVRRVVEDLGDVPTIAEYEARGTHSYRTVANRFGDGSWTAALRELGYDSGED